MFFRRYAGRRFYTGKYFGTDGFRGEAGVTITAEHAYKVGRVLGWYFGLRDGRKCRAVIGKDTRLSSYMLEYALACGLTSSGGDAYIMHVTTTPSVSYVTRCEGFDCGIMVSASHNPFYDNGIKLLNAQGEKMDDNVISVVESYLDGDFTPFGGEDVPFARGRDIGRTVDFVAGRNRYIGHLISLATCSYKGLRVGLDGANGSAFNIARSVFDALGAKTYCIGVDPDGTNVNDNVGSTHIEALKNLVVENSLDIGFAFDGDADRCIAVDGNGNVISGDEEMYISANYLKSRGELAHSKIVCTVLSNGGLVKSLSSRGIDCEICAVGDKCVCDTMTKTGAVLGGERSGHVVFSKYETTGDGLVTAIMIMEAMVENGGFDGLLKGYKSFPQVALSVPVVDKVKAMDGVLSLSERLTHDLDVRIIVRPSGTERVVRVMAEGESEESCALACKILSSKIEANCLIK
ncbi:MAG: phosphoglucosamine mutase [Clostridia bacterium]|nr:phosphoglucosamine mutase [Clostridia bacterium]